MTDDAGANAALADIQPDAFEKWLGERHRWLQTAAARLIETGRMLGDAELDELADLCVKEAGRDADAVFSTVQPGSLKRAAGRVPLRIKRLSEVNGVNALKVNAELNLGATSLAVIYGPNGTGKTSFARLIKASCGARVRDPSLLGNVFEDAAVQPSATVVIDEGGVERELNWTSAQGPLKELRHVHVFDASTAAEYVAKENAATYEPSRMRFVSSLVRVSDRVAERIEQRKVALRRTLAELPAELGETASASWFRKIGAGTGAAEVADICNYAEEHEVERVALEVALAEQNIPKRLEEIAKDGRALEQIRARFDLLRQSLSDEVLGAIALARNEANTKRKAAVEAAQVVFAKAPLSGVGNATWMQLWEHARKYSESHAYLGTKFPNRESEARCVLCQQELGADGKERLGHFEEFVIGEPPRLLRRLLRLRTWSHHEEVEVFPRGARARRSHGVGAPRGASVAMGLH